MVLLQSGNPIQHLISPERLSIAIVFFILALLLIMAMIFAQLYNKKRKHFLKINVQKSLELWISKSILEEYEEGESRGIIIPERFNKRLKNIHVRQYTMEALVGSKKELTGTVAQNIVNIYIQLGLKNDSLRNFNSSRWYKKAKGIEELYVMDQKDMLPAIYKHTNNKNDLVRMEAQTAVINFSGFDGLRFLDVTSLPISEWQQLKMIEQLRRMDVQQMNKLGKWLKSVNDYVVIFALKLVEVFQQYHAHDDAAMCLQHKNEKVRSQAIKTLCTIATETTPQLLTSIYQKESYNNKLKILSALGSIATASELAFLESTVLKEEAIELKLDAAKALVKTGPVGLRKLEEQVQTNHELIPVYNHVKSEVAR